MARLNLLNAKQAENAKIGKLRDGEGLTIAVTASSKKWTLRHTSPITGARREMALRTYPTVGLAAARQMAAAARLDVVRGVDPIEARKEQATASEAQSAVAALAAGKAQAQGAKLSDAIDAHLKTEAATQKGADRAGRWRSPLATHVEPKIGAVPVADITAKMVADVLAPIWLAKPETARMAATRLRAVLRTALAEGDPVGDALRLLPRRPPRVETHHRAIPWAQAPKLYAMLVDEGPNPAALALRWILLTAVRSGEARGARFEELDEQAGVWTIPGARMEGRVGATKPHPVPVTEPMRAIIAQARDRGSAFMVPAPQGNGAKPITDMAPARVLRRLGVDTSVHGLRSTFRDWPADHGVDFEVAEACLAHAVGDSTTRACFRSNLLKRRAVVMQAWAAFVTTGKTVEAVEPIRPRAVG